jgi:rsbT co-antagonist protein RsbR
MNFVNSKEEIEHLVAENKRLTAKLHEYELLIEELSVPIIPSIIPNTILVPLNGLLTPQRFKMIHEKILQHVHQLHADAVLIDFTGISLEEAGKIGLKEVSAQTNVLKNSLELMGVECLFVGFSPQFAQGLVQEGVDLKGFITHSTFRKGLQYLMAKKGIELKYC